MPKKQLKPITTPCGWILSNLKKRVEIPLPVSQAPRQPIITNSILADVYYVATPTNQPNISHTTQDKSPAMLLIPAGEYIFTRYAPKHPIGRLSILADGMMKQLANITHTQFVRMRLHDPECKVDISQKVLQQYKFKLYSGGGLFTGWSIEIYVCEDFLNTPTYYVYNLDEVIEIDCISGADVSSDAAIQDQATILLSKHYAQQLRAELGDDYPNHNYSAFLERVQDFTSGGVLH